MKITDEDQKVLWTTAYGLVFITLIHARASKGKAINYEATSVEAREAADVAVLAITDKAKTNGGT